MRTNLRTIRLIMLTGLVSLVFSCGKKAVVTSNIADYYQYITAYTAGEISKNESIIVKLKQKINNPDALKDKKIFDFSPSIKGSVSFPDKYTVEFIPDEPLTSEESYVAHFNLGALFKVDDKLKDFSFQFRVKPLIITLKTDNLQTTDTKTLKWQKLTCSLVLSDEIDKDKLKQLVKAELDGKAIPIKWLNTNEALRLSFYIDKIQRIEDKQTLVISYDAKSLGVRKNGEKEITIPALNDFYALSAFVVHENTPYIKVNFSDPIRAKQNFNGLFDLGGYTKIKIAVEGNTVKIYPSYKLTGEKIFRISKGIKNILGFQLKKSQEFNLSFSVLKPELRAANKGVILPNSSEGLIYAFDAVGLKKVDFEVTKIFEDNILQFLQVNNLSGNYELRRVGKVVFQKEIDLTEDPDEYGNWNRYSIDLAKYLNVEPGAIYSVKVRFRQSYTGYQCDDMNNGNKNLQTNEETDFGEESNWDYYEDDYYYDWEDRNNPCKKAYYRDAHFLKQNILASNIGIIVKQGEDHIIKVVVNNLLDTKPLSGADIILYNYQQQIIAEEPSNSDGFVSFNIPEKEEPYFIIAKEGKQASFIKLNNSYALSFSRFNVSGKEISEGLKGFIYTERGVWRPGDSIYMSFILNDNAKPLPKKHPIICEVSNPMGDMVFRQVQTKNPKNFYVFAFNTEPDAPTGTYYAKIKVGKKIFSKTLKIETVKPNRLKIKMTIADNAIVRNQSTSGKINVAWLHGAIGKDMKVDVQANIVPVNTYFEKLKDFTFNDITKKIYSKDFSIFNGKTDQNGNVNFDIYLNFGKNAPGFMKANFLIKAFEPGGEFSIGTKSIPYYPYKSYVGLKLPKGDKTRHMLLTDKSHKVEAIVVDKDGNPVITSHQLKFSFYKLSWRWWWDVSANTVSNYSYSQNSKLLSSKVVNSSMGKAKWSIKVKYPNWGRYMVRVEDLTSGHSSSKVVYVDWPGWAGRAQRNNPEGATMLVFSSDKTKYKVGDKAEFVIPGSEGSRALVSIENSSSVVKQFWVECQKGENKINMDITKDMVPNVYVNITMLQPHASTANDLPIRLYGVVPIDVEAPETKLQPVLKMPDELESDANFTLKVSEKNKQEMTYTIAIVDDGLLDLTNFRTPDPWKSFFAHEALGVKTYDFYDDVIGAYGGELQKLLAIGGDDEVPENARKEVSRFPPVVKFIGPFTLKAGKTDSHKIHMPKYVGSVRAMVVAGNKQAYGSVDKTLKVKKPLMLLATLPRVLGPQEIVSLPVSVFVGNNTIKNIKLSVETNPLFDIQGSAVKNLKFKATGDQTVFFKLKVKNTVGIGTVKIIAKSGNFISDYEIKLNVRYPNPIVSHAQNQLIKAGKEFAFEAQAFGLEGTNTAYIEVSSLPAINLEKRLDYLIQYPHGCIEQTTSSVFPQLYVSNILDLPKSKKEQIKKNIEKGISRLSKFQVSSGGFSYWPNQSEANPWGTSYAGHFLIEAKNAGYSVPAGMLRKWKKYQKNRANHWNTKSYGGDLEQAYRLYTLALNGTPEKGAMNRLKGVKTLTNIARWQLATAYAVLGKKNTAISLIQNLTTDVKKYVELSGTFGSSLRDKAIILETFNQLKDTDKGFDVYKDIAEKLSSAGWYNTQAVSYSLIGASDFIKAFSTGGNIKFEYSLNNGKLQNENSSQKIVSAQLAINQTGNQSVKIKNTSGHTLYAQLIMKGQSLLGEEQDEAENMQIAVNYYDLDDRSISIEALTQGKDFYAIVKISNTGYRAYKEMALTQIFPSGWEIINSRMYGSGAYEGGSAKYRDFRDDRVYTYFDLAQGHSRKFKVLLNASYAGKYYMPPVYCAAMYDESIHALKKGEWIEIKSDE